MRRKKVLIAISNGWALRNFLHTGLINRFSKKYDVSIVTNEHMIPYFEGLEKDGVIVSVKSISKDENYLQKRLRQLKKILLLSNYRSSTLIVKSKYWLPLDSLEPLIDYFWKLIRYLPILKFLRIIEAFEKKFQSRTLEEFEKSHDLFISGEPCDPQEIQLQRKFDKADIPTISIIQSWDNPSSKGHDFSKSKKVLVWGEAMKEEVMELYPKLDRKKIVPVGLTQFDQYFENDNISEADRNNFLTGIGIPTDRSIILFATNAKRNSPDDPDLIKLIANEFDSNLLDLNCHLLVRLHQADEFSRYEAISSHPRVTICASSVPDGEGLARWIPPKEELKKLSDFLFFSDVCINTASTMTLDAMVVGLPVLNIGFDMNPTPSLKSKLRFYRYHHWRPLLDENVLTICRSQEELVTKIKDTIRKKPDNSIKIEKVLEHVCNRGKGLAIDNIFEAVEGQLSSPIRNIS